MEFRKSPEEIISPEQEREVVTKVVLEIMRHGKREKGKNAEEEANPDLRLTPAGREQTFERGKKLNPQVDVALAIGGDRTRTRETSARVMLANDGVTPEDSYEDIEAKIDAAMPLHGKKIVEDIRLGYSDAGPISEAANEAYYAGRYLPFVINESDQKAIELGDVESATYTRMAANVAEIVARYLEVGNNFNRIASHTDKYEKYGNQMERYLGTHISISESFAAKAIEKVQGSSQRDEFLEAVAGGFAETEGIHLEIINKGKDQTILMTYKIKDENKQIEIPKEVLDEIIQERKEFEEAVRENLKVKE